MQASLMREHFDPVRCPIYPSRNSVKTDERLRHDVDSCGNIRQQQTPHAKDQNPRIQAIVVFQARPTASGASLSFCHVDSHCHQSHHQGTRYVAARSSVRRWQHLCLAHASQPPLAQAWRNLGLIGEQTAQHSLHDRGSGLHRGVSLLVRGKTCLVPRAVLRGPQLDDASVCRLDLSSSESTRHH